MLFNSRSSCFYLLVWHFVMLLSSLTKKKKKIVFICKLNSKLHINTLLINRKKQHISTSQSMPGLWTYCLEIRQSSLKSPQSWSPCSWIYMINCVQSKQLHIWLRGLGFYSFLHVWTMKVIQSKEIYLIF